LWESWAEIVTPLEVAVVKVLEVVGQFDQQAVGCPEGEALAGVELG
jgi:hypothetical protein